MRGKINVRLALTWSQNDGSGYPEPGAAIFTGGAQTAKNDWLVRRSLRLTGWLRPAPSFQKNPLIGCDFESGPSPIMPPAGSSSPPVDQCGRLSPYASRMNLKRRSRRIDVCADALGIAKERRLAFRNMIEAFLEESESLAGQRLKWHTDRQPGEGRRNSHGEPTLPRRRRAPCIAASSTAKTSRYTGSSLSGCGRTRCPKGSIFRQNRSGTRGRLRRGGRSKVQHGD